MLCWRPELKLLPGIFFYIFLSADFFFQNNFFQKFFQECHQSVKQPMKTLSLAIHSLKRIVENIVVPNFVGFSKTIVFVSQVHPAPIVSVLEKQTHYDTSSPIYDVCMMSYVQRSAVDQLVKCYPGE